MSRNLARTDCRECGGDVIHEEEARPIAFNEAGAYFDEYEGMLVARARCVRCEAQYLAWCGGRHQWRHSCAQGHFDLSYRSTFNDEPDPEDLPIWRVDQFGDRRALIDAPERMAYWRNNVEDGDTSSYAEAVRASQQRWWLRRTAAAEGPLRSSSGPTPYR